MGTATFLHPVDAARALCEAVSNDDAITAEAACTAAGWSLTGSAARRAWEQARAEGFQLAIGEARWVNGGRAVVSAVVTHPERVGVQRPAWFMAEAKAGGWGISGFTLDEAHAAHFYQGDAPAVVDVLDLPSVPAAETWAHAALARVRDELVLTASELEEVVGAPLLGLIPGWAEDGIEGLRALDEEHEVVLAFGDLLGRLIERWRGGPLVIGSATPGEGAPMVAAALAQLHAELDRSTLLVDLDARSPSLHVVFGRWSASPGFTELATGELPPVVAVRDGGHPRLVLLTAGGEAGPNPAAITRFRAWLEDAAPEATFLLAPAGAGPQVAALLGAPMLVVAHAGGVTRSELEPVVARARAQGVPVFGAVATRLLPESVPNDPGEGDALRAFAEGALASWSLIRVGGLPSLGRALVGLQVAWPDRPYPEERWFVLDTSSSPPQVIARGEVPALDLLYTGLPATLPPPTEP